MNYTLHQLKIFRTIEQTGSITRASELLNLTQPAVSIQLKQLQDQFEIRLTEKIGRNIYLTDFGKEVARVSSNILRESELLNDTVNQFKGLLTGSVKISIVSTGKYVIPYFLKSFSQKFPEVKLSIDVSNKNEVIDGLIANTSDFYLVSVLPENIPVKSIVLVDNKLYLVGKNFLSLKHLKKNDGSITLIFREKGSATRDAMENYLKRQGITNYKSMELVSNEAVKQAVCAGLGYSIMPIIGIRNEIQNRSIQIIEAPSLPIITKWHLLSHRNKALTPASSQLLKEIENCKTQVVSEIFSEI